MSWAWRCCLSGTGRCGSGPGGSEMTDAGRSLSPSRRCSGRATNWLRRRRARSVASIMCDMGRMRAIAIAASSLVFVAACSSTEHSAVPGPVPASSSSSSSDAVQQYVNAVDALCDGLEQKFIALNGGHFDIPLKDFLAQRHQHTKLLTTSIASSPRSWCPRLRPPGRGHLPPTSHSPTNSTRRDCRPLGSMLPRIGARLTPSRSPRQATRPSPPGTPPDSANRATPADPRDHEGLLRMFDGLGRQCLSPGSDIVRFTGFGLRCSRLAAAG
jgi:hypothetical protein